MEDVKRISFYSFKGGAGRSTGLCNVAYSIANAGHRVGIIDFDIEAAGLNFVLNVPRNVLEDKMKVQHYLVDEERAKINPTRFKEQMVIDFEELPSANRPWDADPSGRVFFLPAGQNMELTGEVEETEGLMDVIDNLYDTFEEECDLDYLLLDSRSGISNFAMPTLAYADEVAVFFRWSSQHREGTRRLVNWIDTNLSPFGLGVVAVPSSVPLDVEIVNPTTDIAETIDEATIEQWVSEELRDKVRDHQTIPENDLLKVYEQIITPERHPEGQSRAARGYRKLAEKLR